MVIINSFVAPESNIKLELHHVQVVLDNTLLGHGTLYVSENTLCWQNDSGTIGFTLGYYDVSVHGICKDRNVYSTDCIYILTNKFEIFDFNSVPSITNSGGDYNYNDEDNEDMEVSQLYLIPDNLSLISILYEAIKECQELNPDQDDMDDDEELSDESIFSKNTHDQEIESHINGTSDIDIISSRIEHDVNIGNGDGYEEFEDAD